MSRSHWTAVLTLLALAALPLAVPAGDLEPPGAPAPTMKTLVDVEPRTALRNQFDTLTPLVIDQPGSYYLAEDIFAFPSAYGIEITASYVTLDMNGFSLIGNLEVGSWAGIWAHPPSGTLQGIVIKNGTIRDFLGDGIDLTLAKYSRVESMFITHNGLDGTGHGVRADTSIIKDTIVADHPEIGIGGFGNIVTGCISTENDIGISGAVVSTSYALFNTDDGLRTSSNGVISNSSAVANGGDGVQATDSLVIGNAVDGLNLTNGTGIHNEVN